MIDRSVGGIGLWHDINGKRLCIALVGAGSFNGHIVGGIDINHMDQSQTILEVTPGSSMVTLTLSGPVGS